MSILRCSYHGGSAWAGRVEDVMRAVGMGRGRRVGLGSVGGLAVMVVGKDILVAPAQTRITKIQWTSDGRL